MNIMTTPMLGAFLGGWEAVLLLTLFVGFVLVVAGAIILLLYLNLREQRKRNAALTVGGQGKPQSEAL
jgi:hypothetical protein